MYESVSAAAVLVVCGLSRPTSLTTNISVQSLDLLLVHLRHNLTFQFHRRPYNTHNIHLIHYSDASVELKDQLDMWKDMLMLTVDSYTYAYF